MKVNHDVGCIGDGVVVVVVSPFTDWPIPDSVNHCPLSCRPAGSIAF